MESCFVYKACERIPSLFVGKSVVLIETCMVTEKQQKSDQLQVKIRPGTYIQTENFITNKCLIVY